MELNNLIKQLTENFNSILDKPFVVDFILEDDSMVPPGKKIDKLVIKPLFVGTVIKMQPLLLKIKQKDLKEMVAVPGVDFTENTPFFFNKYEDIVLDIITIAIHNKKGDPPSWFKSMLKWNTTWKDLHLLFNAAVYRMGYRNFINSISVAEAMLSLQNEEEIIALQQKWSTRAS